MISIIILSLFIIIGLISIAQYYSFFKECSDERIRFSYMILSFSVAGSSFVQLLMKLLFGSKIEFVLYGCYRLCMVLVMIQIIELVRAIIVINEKLLRSILAGLVYGALIIYIIDILTGDGIIKMGLAGVYYMPASSWHIALYIIYYMLFVAILIVSIVYRSNNLIHKSDKHDVDLISIVFAISAIGIVGEQFIIFYTEYFFPLSVVMNLISVILMRNSINYHRAIDTSIDTFSRELDPARLDIVFVLDDELKVMYQNKRAEIFGQIIQDEFIGKKITDIFKFDDSVYGQINAEPSSVPFGVVGKYVKNDHQVNMIIQHRIDNYKEILATTVIVYILEDNVEKDAKAVESRAEEEKIEIAAAIEITKGAKILVVDEDTSFVNVFVRMLKNYQVDVISAGCAGDFRKAFRNNVFDMVFVSNELSELAGADIVKEIRATQGEYYKQVPIVIITDSDINDVYSEFISSGFSDYLSKPVSVRALSLVLTRWLWRRFSDNDEKTNAVKTLQKELSELKTSAEIMHDSGKTQMLSYVVNAIKKLAGRDIGEDNVEIANSLADILKLCDSLLEAVMFEDKSMIESVYERLLAEMSSVISIG